MEIYPIRVEFILELLLLLLGPTVDHLAPSGIHPIVGSQLAVNLLHRFSEELCVLALLDLVIGHAESFQPHRRVAPAVVRNKEEPHDFGASLIKARVGLHVELLTAAYDWPLVAARLVDADASVGVDLIDHWPGRRVLGFHSGCDCCVLGGVNHD